MDVREPLTFLAILVVICRDTPVCHLAPVPPLSVVSAYVITHK